MASQEFNISIDTSQAQTFFARLAANLQGQAQFRKAVGAIIEKYIQGSFDGERTPAGVPWANLKPKTVAARTRKGQVPIRKLQATGAGKAGISVVVTGTGLVVQMSKDYMDLHNVGTRTMAARRWLPTEQELANGAIGQEIESAASAFLTQGLGGFVQGEIGRTGDFVSRLLG